MDTKRTEHPEIHTTEGRTMDGETIRLIARDEAEQMILRHITLCPFANLNIEKRLRNVELRFSTLIAFLLGARGLGGLAGGIAAKLIR